MTLHSVIGAHVQWLIRLVDLLEAGGSLSIDQVRRDDVCRLGSWIVEHRDRWGDLPEFQRVRDLHADFHACAAEAVGRANDGHFADAVQRIDAEDGCARLSDRLLDAFVDLHERLCTLEGCDDPIRIPGAEGGDPGLPWPESALGRGPDQGTQAE